MLQLITHSDPAITAYTHDAVMAATPDCVARPASREEVCEIATYCSANAIPLTVSAARTSMTGSSVTDRGLLLSVEKMNRILSLDEDAAIVTVEPGVILGDLQRFVESRGFFYPPSPTSRNECTVGATIATNATGDTTFKYGTTRRYVQELTMVMVDGTLRTITRTKMPPAESKNKAGFFLGGEEIDHFIGSEGTLGIIVEAKLKLLRGVPESMTFMIPFSKNADALHFIASHDHYNAISPRTMEYVDQNAATIMRSHPEFPALPDDARAFALCQQEYVSGAEDDTIDAWLSTLHHHHTRCSTPHLTEVVIVARSSAEQSRIAAWRHHIPATIAEKHRALQQSGGGKVGTDWWVPLPQMMEMMVWMYSESDALGIPYIAFAHLGNGHPHVNYLTRNPQEKEKAMAFVLECCRRAVHMGGGVAGEHGIGKIKRSLLAIQHPLHVIEDMRRLKSHYDPQWLLAPGNIFNSPSI